MPLYMDLHKVEGQGMTAEDVAAAHFKDEEVQEKYGVKYLTYWFNEAVGKLFCLVEAPSVNAAVTVHREAHGLIADEIIEVEARGVESFLGKIEDTAAAAQRFQASQPPADNAFRTILFTDMKGSTTITQRLGDAVAMDYLRTHDAIIRGALKAEAGNEVKHTGDGIMASFASVSHSIECAIAMQRAFIAHNERNPDSPIRVRIGLSAGEPVTENQDLFGAAVQLASRICDCAEPGRILVSNVVRELCLGKGFLFTDWGEAELKGFEELVRLFEVRWREEG